MKRNKNIQSDLTELENILDENKCYICVTNNFIIAKGSGLDMMLNVSKIIETVTKGIDPRVFCDIILGYIENKHSTET